MPPAIATIMTTRVATVHMDDSLRIIAEIFENARFHHLLVVEGKELCGIISDRDLLKASSPFLNTVNEQARDLALMNRKAHQIMTRNLVTVTPETSIEDAARLLVQSGVSCLPVVTVDGNLAGILSWKDLFKAFVSGLETL